MYVRYRNQFLVVVSNECELFRNSELLIYFFYVENWNSYHKCFDKSYNDLNERNLTMHNSLNLTMHNSFTINDTEFGVQVHHLSEKKKKALKASIIIIYKFEKWVNMIFTRKSQYFI